MPASCAPCGAGRRPPAHAGGARAPTRYATTRRSRDRAAAPSASPFLAPTGLADGLARKESRYVEDSTIRPCGRAALVPPFLALGGTRTRRRFVKPLQL